MMRNWRNSVTSILNTRCSPYPYITPALSTLHRTHTYIRRETIEREREGYTIRGEEVEDEHIDMMVRPAIGSTTLLTIVISMKKTQITSLLLPQRCP